MIAATIALCLLGAGITVPTDPDPWVVAHFGKEHREIAGVDLSGTVAAAHKFAVRLEKAPSLSSDAYIVIIEPGSGISFITGTSVDTYTSVPYDNEDPQGVWSSAKGAAAASDGPWLLINAESVPSEATIVIRKQTAGGSPTILGHQRIRFAVQKLMCEGDASIDTRTGYGAENVAGAIVGNTDPTANMNRRNLNYGNWTFRGGLFAGHIH